MKSQRLFTQLRGPILEDEAWPVLNFNSAGTIWNLTYEINIASFYMDYPYVPLNHAWYFRLVEEGENAGSIIVQGDEFYQNKFIEVKSRILDWGTALKMMKYTGTDDTIPVDIKNIAAADFRTRRTVHGPVHFKKGDSLYFVLKDYNGSQYYATCHCEFEITGESDIVVV